jgi:hypothetical protein
VKDFVGDLLRESAGKHYDNIFAEGYNEAANICVGVLSKHIDGLLKQIKSQNYLSNEEQFLLSRLNELKLETESELRDYWADADKE